MERIRDEDPGEEQAIVRQPIATVVFLTRSAQDGRMLEAAVIRVRFA